MQWLGQGQEGGLTATLSTESEDGIVRIWKCLPDEPHFFVLWLTIELRDSASVPIANLWIAVESVGRLLSFLEDGSIVLHEVQVRRIFCEDI